MARVWDVECHEGFGWELVARYVRREQAEAHRDAELAREAWRELRPREDPRGLGTAWRLVDRWVPDPDPIRFLDPNVALVP